MKKVEPCDHEWCLHDDRATNIMWACEKCHVVQDWTPKDVQEARDEAAIDKYEMDRLWVERGE